MTITTQRTLCGKYLVLAEQNGEVFAACSHNKSDACSSAIRGCYEYIEFQINTLNRK